MSMGTAKNFDEVCRNKIWEEHVKKETRTLKLGEEFHISDPRKMTILPEKVNHYHPSQSASKEAAEKAAAELSQLSSLKDTEKLPAERFALPLTGNQEYGFFSAKPLVKPNPMFDYKRGSCDVTGYADSYVLSSGQSPYARRDGGH